jgi:hypothetical protein
MTAIEKTLHRPRSGIEATFRFKIVKNFGQAHEGPVPD